MTDEEVFDAGFIDALEGNIPYASLDHESIFLPAGVARVYSDGWCAAMRARVS